MNLRPSYVAYRYMAFRSPGLRLSLAGWTWCLGIELTQTDRNGPWALRLFIGRTMLVWLIGRDSE